MPQNYFATGKEAVLGCAPHIHKSGCWSKAVTHVGKKQKNLQQILTPCFPLGISSCYLSREWRDNALQSVVHFHSGSYLCTAISWREHTHQGDVKPARLRDQQLPGCSSCTPGAWGDTQARGWLCFWAVSTKKHLRFVCASHRSQNWRLKVVQNLGMMEWRCGVSSQPSQSLPWQL